MKDSKGTDFKRALSVFGGVAGFNILSGFGMSLLSPEKQEKLKGLSSIGLILYLTWLVKNKYLGMDKVGGVTMLWGIFISNVLNQMLFGQKTPILSYDPTILPTALPLKIEIGNQEEAKAKAGLGAGSNLDEELAKYYAGKQVQKDGLGNIRTARQLERRDQSVRYAA